MMHRTNSNFLQDALTGVAVVLIVCALCRAAPLAAAEEVRHQPASLDPLSAMMDASAAWRGRPTNQRHARAAQADPFQFLDPTARQAGASWSPSRMPSLPIGPAESAAPAAPEGGPSPARPEAPEATEGPRPSNSPAATPGAYIAAAIPSGGATAVSAVASRQRPNAPASAVPRGAAETVALSRSSPPQRSRPTQAEWYAKFIRERNRPFDEYQKAQRKAWQPILEEQQAYWHRVSVAAAVPYRRMAEQNQQYWNQTLNRAARPYREHQHAVQESWNRVNSRAQEPHRRHEERLQRHWNKVLDQARQPYEKFLRAHQKFSDRLR